MNTCKEDGKWMVKQLSRECTANDKWLGVWVVNKETQCKGRPSYFILIFAYIRIASYSQMVTAATLNNAWLNMWERKPDHNVKNTVSRLNKVILLWCCWTVVRTLAAIVKWSLSQVLLYEWIVSINTLMWY